ELVRLRWSGFRYWLALTERFSDRRPKYSLGQAPLERQAPDSCEDADRRRQGPHRERMPAQQRPADRRAEDAAGAPRHRAEREVTATQVVRRQIGDERRLRGSLKHLAEAEDERCGDEDKRGHGPREPDAPTEHDQGRRSEEE